MIVDVDRFSEMLADRLAAIVPAGFGVHARDGMLWYYSAHSAGQAGSYVLDNFGLHGETDEDNIVGLTVQVLDELRDYVSEAIGDPWPGTSGQPSPRGEIRDAALYAWYDDPGGVVLGCDPIKLADIAG